MFVDKLCHTQKHLWMFWGLSGILLCTYLITLSAILHWSSLKNFSKSSSNTHNTAGAFFKMKETPKQCMYNLHWSGRFQKTGTRFDYQWCLDPNFWGHLRPQCDIMLYYFMTSQNLSMDIVLNIITFLSINQFLIHT